MPENRRLAGAVAGLFAVVVVAGACSGSSSGPAPSSNGASAPSATSASPSDSASTSVPGTTSAPSSRTAPPSSSSRPGTAPSSRTPTGPVSTVPSVQRTTRPAVSPSRPAQFGGNVSVTLTKSTSYTAKGQGPGEISGPAVAFTLVLRNSSGATVSLQNSNVTADYGSNHTPASQLSASPSKPWTGSVRTGSSATGVYCFSIPSGQRSLVTLTISYDPTKAVVIIQGSAR